MLDYARKVCGVPSPCNPGVVNPRHFRKCAGISNHKGDLSCHRLRYDQPERLVPDGWENSKIDVGEEFLSAHPANPLDALIDLLESMGDGFLVFHITESSVPCENKAGILLGPSDEISERMREHVHAFVSGQPPEEADAHRTVVPDSLPLDTQLFSPVLEHRGSP